MTQQLAFTIDTALKNSFMKKTKQQGVTMKAYLTFCIQAYVNGKLWLQVQSLEDTNRNPTLEKSYQEAKHEYANWETVSLDTLIDSLCVTK